LNKFTLTSSPALIPPSNFNGIHSSSLPIRLLKTSQSHEKSSPTFSTFLQVKYSNVLLPSLDKSIYPHEKLTPSLEKVQQNNANTSILLEAAPNNNRINISRPHPKTLSSWNALGVRWKGARMRLSPARPLNFSWTWA
jgi:hypothetical protein